MTGSLPSNIIQLNTSYRRTHLFPHLTTYNIQECVFASSSVIDLPCLENLNIIGLVIFDGTEVHLPALRRLTCSAIRLRNTGKIIAPFLESMHISRRMPIDFYQRWAGHTEETIKTKGFLLSPSHSLTVEVGFPLDIIVKLLEGCPHVERVSLGFGDEECAVQVLKRIGWTALEDESEGIRLCGRLRELRLSFLWDKCGVEGWKERADLVVKRRVRNGIMLKIYGMWKGEGAYVLLAE